MNTKSAHSPSSAEADLESRLAAAVASPSPTVVHLWAPWCPDCRAELLRGGWSRFIAAYPSLSFVFVSVWSPTDGRAELAGHGLVAPHNAVFLHHPNPSRAREERMDGLLGQPVHWIPTTWIYRDGRLLYAMNYGRIRFPILRQLIRDASSA